MPLEPEPVILGDLSFEAGVRRLDLSLSSGLPRHPVERGADIADHVVLQPAEFRVDVPLFGDRDELYLRLRALRDAREPQTFVCSFGAFDDVVLADLSPTVEASRNVYQCSLALKQIRIGEARTVLVRIVDTVTGNAVPGKPVVDETAKSPVKEERADAPLVDLGKPVLSQIWEWLT